MEKNKKIKILTFFFLASAFFIILPATAQAATLYFSPSSGTHAVGTSFTVNVYVSSAEQAMNAASGVISFPSDKLEVTSLSKSGSIFSLWVQEPSFSNSPAGGRGTVNFEGIALNPGFKGASGKLLAVNFRVKTAGVATLNFSSGSVLANDGQGTNILTSLGTASFSLGIEGPSAPEATTPSEIIGAPAAPEISSPTHPDSNKWYAQNNAKFSWPVPSGVTGVRLLVGKIPTAVPTVVYIPAISSRELKDLADGVWYFSVQLRNNVGWGAISRFRFQIDTEKPDHFDITEVERTDLTDPHAKFVFDASDKTSGIDHYEIQIGNESPQIYRDDGNSRYETAFLAPGKYTLIAKAFDKAGNYLANSVEFIVKALEPPIITDYPKELTSGEILIIKGITKYPDAQINIFLQHEKDEPKNYSVRNDKDGKFIFIVEDRLSNGIYNAWIEAIDVRGVKSGSSEKITILVKQPKLIKIGYRTIEFLAVIIPLVALIFSLLFIIWYGWYKFSLFRKKIKKETSEAEKTLHQAFNVLEEEIKKQIARLDGKPYLSTKEKKIYDELKKTLEIFKKFIGKEIKDIEKEINK